MKKTLLITGAVVIVLAVILGVVWLRFTGSPEYALMQIFKDVNELEIDGLRPHLTANAQDVMDKINDFADNKLVNMIVGVFDMQDDITELKTKLQETEWGMVDIMKGDSNAVAILSFDYDDDLSGTVEISMIKEEKQWKIDSLQLPKFDEKEAAEK